MSILKSAYDARVAVAYKTSKIADAVVAAHLGGNTQEHFGGKVQTLDIEGDSTSLVPVFSMPLLVERDGSKTIYIDMRSNTTFDRAQQAVRIRNRVEYDAKIILGSLCSEWTGNFQDTLLINNPVSLSVYAALVSEAIGKRVGLDAMSQLRIAILAGIFYMNCFVTEEEQESRDYKARLISMISRHCNFRNDEISAAVQEYYNINGLEELCDAIRNYTQARRLDDLNTSTLIEYVGAYWYGNNGKELIAVALEYPPMWFYILYLSFTDRSFRNTRLFSITDRNTFAKPKENFIRGMLARGIDA